MGEKSILLSKGFWGSLAVILLSAAPLLGIDADALGLDEAGLAELLYQLSLLGGGVMALVGRLRARRRLVVKAP